MNNPFLGYQWNTFRWQNPYWTPTTERGSTKPQGQSGECTTGGKAQFYTYLIGGYVMVRVGVGEWGEAWAIGAGTGVVPEASPAAVPAVVAFLVSGTMLIAGGFYAEYEAYLQYQSIGGWNCVNPFN